MLSVCIPVYNFDVTQLVFSLEKEMNNLEVEVEIVLIDDASDVVFKKINQQVFSKHQAVLLAENIDRSKIRNLFLEHTKYSYLLFLDCDGEIISPNFLKNYIEAIRAGSKIICGGRVYGKQKPANLFRLRWNYGIKRESKTMEERLVFPNKSFMTNNFVILKELLQKIKFDEALSQYGHEDTLFGIELKNKGIKIHHINNSVLNIGLEINSDFLAKTDAALTNLVNITKKTSLKKQLQQEVTLLKTLCKIQNFKLKCLLDISFYLLQSPIKYVLCNGYPSVALFSFYKLGKYSNLSSK